MRSLVPMLCAAALLLAGCASALSPELTQSADSQLTFSQLQSDPEAYNGKIVILCGVIVETRNLQTGAEIEILQKEADFWGKPIRTDRSGGQFLVRKRAFLDPLIYASGREITVGGVVRGADRGLVVIDARELRLWERMRPASGDPSWMDPLSDRGIR